MCPAAVSNEGLGKFFLEQMSSFNEISFDRTYN